MNPQLWWFLSRSSGLVAWALLAAAVMLGAAMRTRLVPRRRMRTALSTHRTLSVLALMFTGLHVTGLLLDDYVGFGVTDVLVPMAAPWRPFAVSLGILTLYLMLAVALSSKARRHLPRRVWRGVHLTSYLSFWLATFHLLRAGTDAENPLVFGAAVLVGGAVVFLTVLRILAPDPDPAPAVRAFVPTG